MAFLTPLALLLGLLAGPIILMYMLRLRRREVLVSSTLLWQKLVRDREANAPWQRLRRNLLLLLQLLILALLALALARPFLPIPRLVSGSVVILLDASASMQATDVAPSRFAAAQAAVDDLIGGLGRGNQMTIIQVGQTPSVLVAASDDPVRLRNGLAAARVENGAANWAAALALASGAAQGFSDARIVVISDGGLPADLPAVASDLVYLPIGRHADNLALTALATRPTADGAQLFATVANQGGDDREALLSIHVDGRLFDSRRLDVPAGGSANATWPLPPEARLIRAVVDAGDAPDYLTLDDQAWAVNGGGVANRALLLTPGNLFLEQVFSILPGVAAFRADPAQELAAYRDQTFALYVLDSQPLPAELPDGDLLLINPRPAPADAGQEVSLTVQGIFSQTTVTRLADDPILQFVDWGNVHVRQATAVSAPWARPIVESVGGPLLLAGEWNGRRLVILTFDLHDSDLPLQIAFPVLMANITAWLSPGQAFDAPGGLRPGEVLALNPGAGATAVLVDRPDGETWTAPTSDAPLLFADTAQPGIYTVRIRDGAGERAGGSFAVNLFTPAESAIAPRPSVTIGLTEAGPADGADVGQRELWPWLALVALIVLLTEWWIYHQGSDLSAVRALRRRFAARAN